MAEKKNLTALQKIERSEQRRKKVFWALVGVISLCILSLIGYLYMANKDSNENKTTLKSSKQLTPKNITSEGSFQVLKDGAVNSNNPPQYKTKSTFVELVFDPMCPACGAFDRAMNKTLLKDVNSGKIDLYLSPVAFLDRLSTDQYSTRAANSLVTVAENDPKHFYSYMTTLYEEKNQPKEGASYQSVSNDQLIKFAKEAGVSSKATDKFKENSYTDWISKRTNAMNDSRKDLFPDGLSTPGLFVGGRINNDQIAGTNRVMFNNESDVKQAYEDAVKKYSNDISKIGGE